MFPLNNIYFFLHLTPVDTSFYFNNLFNFIKFQFLIIYYYIKTKKKWKKKNKLVCISSFFVSQF